MFCKLGNFPAGFIFAKLAYVEFRENKTLANWLNHSVDVDQSCPSLEF